MKNICSIDTSDDHGNDMERRIALVSHMVAQHPIEQRPELVSQL